MEKGKNWPRSRNTGRTYHEHLLLADSLEKFGGYLRSIRDSEGPTEVVRHVVHSLADRTANALWGIGLGLYNKVRAGRPIVAGCGVSPHGGSSRWEDTYVFSNSKS